MNPLSVECYPCSSPIGVPCHPSGTACANRITRALAINFGVVLSPADRTAALDPGRAPSPVVGEDPAKGGRS